MRWKFLVLGILFLILSLIGIVSADVNWANQSGAVPQFNKIRIEGSGMNWLGSASDLNDNNIGTYIGFGDPVPLSSPYWGEFEGIITFADTAPEITEVYYYLSGSMPNFRTGSVNINTFLLIDGTWNNIDSRGIPLSEVWGGVNLFGVWNNVDAVKVYVKTEISVFRDAENPPFFEHLSEIRALGPCTPETNATFCSRLGIECGSYTGDDNCGTPRTVDCGDCDILYPGEGRVCNAVGICVLPPPDLTNASWASMNSSAVITEADLYDRVRLMVNGTGLEGETINYSIEKYVSFWWLFRYWSEVASFSDLGYSTWKANETGTYRFTASIIGDGSATSGDLIVSASEDNTPPVTEILSPGICEIYFTGESIGFTQNSSDIDDNIAFYWEFGDGNTSTLRNPVHIYTTGGQKTIILTVTDERGRTATDRTTILVVDASKTLPEKYICAYINEPEWGENVYGFDIFFNATDTYAINATCNAGSCSQLECIAGICKNQTFSGMPVSGTIPNWPGFENINFSWVFDDGFTYKESGMSGAWFTKTYSNTGSHWAKLTASINPESSIETKFNIMNKTPQKEIEKSKEDTIIPFKDLILALILLLIIVIIYLRLSKKRGKKKKL